METRKITIANTRDQKKTVIMTAATTLGELKRDLDREGIIYGDLDFIEALTKTQLRGDDSVLPHDVPYNHTTTNELVFLLTVPNRKIKSGVDRAAVYSNINNHDHSAELKEAIKNHFGRNYTMVRTDDLQAFLEIWNYEAPHCECCETMRADITDDERITALEHKMNNLTEAMMNVIDALEDEGVYTCDIYSALTKSCKSDNTVYSAGMTEEDIDNLIASVD